MKEEIILSALGSFLSLVLCFIAFRIHQKSHSIRKHICIAGNNEEIIINDIVKHFDDVVIQDISKEDYDYIKSLFQKEINSKIHAEIEKTNYNFYDCQVKNSLHNIYLHENVVKNLNYKKNDLYFIRKYTDLYVDIFKIILYVNYAKNNNQHFNLNIKEQSFNLSEYKFTVKENEKGIEAISVE